MALNARNQFGPRAAEYASSVVHSRGAAEAVARLDPAPEAIALDVGTGAGHTAHALARRCRFAFAADITPEMLNQSAALARDLGLDNVQPISAVAERLPFASSSLGAVSCRLAAHHFEHPEAFCAEVSRVLTTGGRALFVDVCVPEDDEAAAYINDIEVHRDHSHVEDYTPTHWRELVEGSGLLVIEERVSSGDLATEELITWTQRAGTSVEDVEYIRRRFMEAPRAVVEALKLERDGDTFRWRWPVITIVGEKTD